MLEVKMKNTTITMLTNKHQILWKVVYIVKYFTMFLCLFCVTWCFSDNWTSMKVLQWLLVYKKQNGFRNGPLNIILLVPCKNKQLISSESWILQKWFVWLVRILNIMWILLPVQESFKLVIMVCVMLYFQEQLRK